MGFDLGVMSAAVTLDDREYKSALGGLESASMGTFRKIAQLAAGYLSLRALYTGSKLAIQAFMTQQAAVEGIRASLRNLNHEVEGTTARFSAFASSMQGKTTFGDEAILANMSQGMRLGIKPDEIENVTRAAIGLTAKLGVDLPTAMSLMARASQGHTETLARYGITLDATKSKEEQFRDLVKQGAEAFPLAEAATKTAEGQLRQFKNTVGDTAEALGGQLWNALGGTVSQLNALFKGFNDATQATQGLVVKTTLLAAGLVAFAKTGIGNALMTAKGATAQEREVAEMKAREEVKRAELAKTTADEEEKLARQNAALAENAVAVAKNEEAKARAALVDARRRGDIAAAVAAQTALTQAEHNLAKAEVEAAKAQQKLNEKTLAAKTATENYAALSQALPGVLAKVALAQTLLGKASMFTAGGFTKAAGAVKAFMASLGPVGWAIIALTAAYAAYEYWASRQAAALEEQARKAEEAVVEQNKLIESSRKRRTEENQAVTRLQTLMKYEKLNASEMAEAERLISKLKSQYGDLNISLDRNTGKINANAEAWGKLAEAQRNQAVTQQKELIRRLRRQGDDELQKLDNDLGGWSTAKGRAYREAFKEVKALSTAEGKLILLENLRQGALDDGDNAAAEKMEKAIAVYQQQVDAEKDYRNMRRGGDINGAPKTIADTAKENEERRKLRKATEETEWKIRFDAADAEDQAQMLADRIDKIFAESKRQGKFPSVADFVSADRGNMTEDELKDLQKIVELENERRKIRKKAEEEAGEKALERARKAGDQDAVREIMEREYKRAKAAAETLQKAFADADAAARADDELTDAEKTKLQNIKNDLRDALTDADRWKDRIDEQERRQKTDTIGNFSAAVLAAQLGANKPEEETAKNTKEMVRLQNKLIEKSGKTGTLAYR